KTGVRAGPARVTKTADPARTLRDDRQAAFEIRRFSPGNRVDHDTVEIDAGGDLGARVVLPAPPDLELPRSPRGPQPPHQLAVHVEDPDHSVRGPAWPA